ncbi:protein LEAD-SENSITIVE 1-like [Silene latifolia]|uniref:protein LEAD-SENSITIVE 1-like n=1 Tax=Silene latifolia TaxID=37657 RepID=UPI003D783201
MGLVSDRVRKEDIKPGDHIYTWRACYTYSHHGIYVGGNKVVHFTNPTDGGLVGLSTSSCHSTSKVDHPSPCPASTDCGFRQPDSGVVLSCIDCFLGKGSLRLFKYGVTKFTFQVKRPGTCTTAQPDLSETVIHRANYLLQHGFGNYDMVINNCEDFAIYCKTGLLDKNGLGRSGQVTSVTAAVPIALVAKVISNAVAVAKNPVAAVSVAVGAGLYCMTRHKSDIGVGTDVIKVPVEKLAGYIGPRLPSKPPLSLPPVNASRGLKEIAELDRLPRCIDYTRPQDRT